MRFADNRWASVLEASKKNAGVDTLRWLSLSWSFLSRLRYYDIVFGAHRILADAPDSPV